MLQTRKDNFAAFCEELAVRLKDAVPPIEIKYKADLAWKINQLKRGKMPPSWAITIWNRPCTTASVTLWVTRWN
jgi:hypothetical protein